MNSQLARTDRLFGIERKTIIEFICNNFKNLGRDKIIFNLFGTSGVGKSYICKSIYYSKLIVSEDNKVLIDFNCINNNNMPGIIELIVSKFGYEFFSETQSLLEKYFKSVDASKTEYLSKCVDVFIEELNSFSTIRGSLLIIFDTFEILSANTLTTGLMKIVEKTNNSISFLISGISRVNFFSCISHRIDGFNETEIKKYLTSRNPRIKSVFKKHESLLLSQIRKYTEDGNPILCGLLSDWLLNCRDINSQIDYLLSSEDTSRKHLVNWISELDESMSTTMRLTAFFNDRMTVSLLSSLSGMGMVKSKESLVNMGNYSFVKYISQELDEEPQIVLHEIVAKLIRVYFPFSKNELLDFVSRAVSEYDKMIVEEKTNIEAFSLEHSLKVEKIMCMIRNGSFENAMIMFDNSILDGIDVFDYWFVDQLINELENYLSVVLEENYSDAMKENKEKWEYLLSIAKAEVELSKFRANESITLYEELKNRPLYKVGLYKALADGIFGRSLINPCTVNRMETPLDAIKMLNQSLKTITKTELDRRIVKTNYWLGNAYVRSGQNEKAHVAYEHSLSQSNTDIQKVTILLEISKMKRLQQDVYEALEPLQICDAIMETLKKSRGKYYYYKGNIYRDLDNIQVATIYYEKAFKELESGDDNFTLCELNLDFAWLQYIRDDVEEINIVEVTKYLNEGWKYAIQYNFGTEFSEYHHILYEIENYLGEYQSAYLNLDKAIEYAYRYSNIYMILDCLNHRVQRCYREKKYDIIPEILQEMEKIEKKGCKIRVFRGRAKLVQADVYFECGDYESAIQEYFDGFVIVALYGNSRSNVELFDDLFNNLDEFSLSRRDKIIQCLANISDSDRFRRKFRSTWSKKKISKEYGYFLDSLRK